MSAPQPYAKRFDKVKGRVIYVLLVMLVLQLTYPLSLLGTVENGIYLGAYCTLFTSGVYAVSVTRRRFYVALGLALLNLIVGIPWLITGTIWLTLSTYAALILFQGVLVYTLLEFVFYSDGVGRDVIYGAVTVYILFGNIFSAFYMIIQTLEPQAFVTPDGQIVVWQRMVYFSYATLTTLGYGDIAPRSAWAQSVASLEAILGSLYIAVIIGRLIGVYHQEGDYRN